MTVTLCDLFLTVDEKNRRLKIKRRKKDQKFVSSCAVITNLSSFISIYFEVTVNGLWMNTHSDWMK